MLVEKLKNRDIKKSKVQDLFYSYKRPQYILSYLQDNKEHLRLMTWFYGINSFTVLQFYISAVLS